MKSNLTLYLHCCVLFVLISGSAFAQGFSSPTVVIPTGGQTCIPLTVSGLPSTLYNYQIQNAFPVLLYVEINIQTTHPWTLHVTLVSPQGTSLVLTSLNGFGGGSNYTGTVFVNPPGSNINTAMPPFTGSYEPEGLPGLSVFDGQNPNGTWFICVNDTMTDTTSVGGGPPGFGATSSGSGTMGFGNGGSGGGGGGSGCVGMMQNGIGVICPNETFVVSWAFGLNGWTFSPASVNGPGTYLITGTDPWGCQDSETLIVYDGGIDIGLDATAYVCAGQTIDLTVYFDGNNPNIMSLDAYLNGSSFPTGSLGNASTPGQYLITAWSIANCYDDVTITLIQHPSPQIGPDQTVDICPGDQSDLTQFFNLTGLTQTAWTFNGSPIGSGAVTAASQPGIYQVIGTNSNGCTDTANVILNNMAPPQLGTDIQLDVCQNASVDLNTLYNTSGLTVNWTFNNQPVSNPASVNQPGTYTLIATNSAGCPDTAEAVISNLPAPNIGPDQQDDFCLNDQVDLVSHFNLTGLYSDWTFNGNPVASPASVNIPGSYQLVVTNNIGCTDTALMVLSGIPAPALGTNQTVNLCPGASENLNTVFNLTGLTANWSLGGISVPDVSAISTPGNYQLVATNSSGCTDTAIALVSSVAAPTLGPDQLLSGCQGDAFNLTTLYSTGTNTVQWTFGGSTVNNPASVTLAGNYQITVTNSFGCTNSSVATIQLNALPVLGTDHSIEFCSNTTYDLTGLFNLSGLTAVWSLNGGVVNDPQAITAGGNYQLVATNTNSCRDTAVVFAQMNTAPDLGADQSYMLCPWMTVDLDNTFSFNGLTPSWTVNGLPYTVGDPIHDAGTYQVNVTDANGCLDVAAVVIDTMFCECEADFVYTGKCIQEPVTFTLLADSVIVNAVWSFSHPLMPQRSEINPVVKFYGDEPVQVTLLANLSCGVQTIEKTVVFEDCAEPCPVYLPTAFTPNTDGKNERFQVFTECFPLEFELEIHNRFGQMIFSSSTPSLGWDGKQNETPSPEGLYVYRLGYKMPYQKKVVKTGTIALIR